MGTAFNGTAEHNIGFITTALDYLTLSISNPSKWTWLWGEYENINGTRFNDILSGNSFNNSLNGGDGDDYLIGGAGNDTFDWNPDLRSGADTMEGGEGTYLKVLILFMLVSIIHFLTHQLKTLEHSQGSSRG